MDLFEALYTTRAMRRLRPDPIPSDVQARILDAAVRAPSATNTQEWRFLLVDDPAVKAVLAPLYQDSIAQLFGVMYKDRIDAATADPEHPDSVAMFRMQRSVQYLADHFEEVPLYLFGFVRGDTSGGSIYPAIWSAMLAARALGVGSALTSIMGMLHRDELLTSLGVPSEEGWVCSCTVPFGYPAGRWGVAQRRPVHEVAFRNQWGTPVGFEVPAPLWP